MTTTRTGPEVPEPAGTGAGPMQRGAPTRSDRVHAALLVLGASAMGAWWADFLTRGSVRLSDEAEYDAWEKSFVLADAYVAGTALATAGLLWKGRPEAVGVGIAAGSGATFLALADVARDAQMRSAPQRRPQMALEAALSATSLVLGQATMWRLWRARHRLGA